MRIPDETFGFGEVRGQEVARLRDLFEDVGEHLNCRLENPRVEFCMSAV